MTMHESAATPWSCSSKMGAGLLPLAAPSLLRLRKAACMYDVKKRRPVMLLAQLNLPLESAAPFDDGRGLMSAITLC